MTPPSAAPRDPSKRVCPTCEEPSPADGPYRPFCSARCKWVDLGRWLDGDYVVPGEGAIDFDVVAEYEERKAREGGGDDTDG
ncbi:MAG: DNA gyrase inhibitor YacG [Planctomycetota bacterium]|nr:DNA gyrase inhibitor YacG [Planctomycetota bacterium]